MTHAWKAAAAALALLALAPGEARAWGIDFQDTYLSIRYLPEDKQPGYRKDVNEVAGNIAYANAWTYGSNFASIDFEDFSSRGDPANSVTGRADSNSAEVYALFRTVLSGNKVTGSNMFSFGPVRDVGLLLGFDFDTQDDAFASYKKLITFGPQFSINLPRGFLTITLGLSHEWNTNGFLQNGNGANFDPAFTIETAWAFPFAVGPVPLNFTGFANLITPKGKGATTDYNHGTEILLHPKLMVDVGELLGYVPKKVEAGVGYEYWHNKFGGVPRYVPGTEQNSVFVEVGYHF